MELLHGLGLCTNDLHPRHEYFYRHLLQYGYDGGKFFYQNCPCGYLKNLSSVQVLYPVLSDIPSEDPDRNNSFLQKNFVSVFRTEGQDQVLLQTLWPVNSA